MAKMTSEQYFRELRRELTQYESELNKLNDPVRVNMYCIDEEKKYRTSVFEVAVKIYNKLESEEAKQAFGLKVVTLFGDLAKDKSKSLISQYNECKNIFDAIRGALLAMGEGKALSEIDELLADTYKYMHVPFQTNENNGYNHIRNNVYDVVVPEFNKEKQAGNSNEC